jgi:hypothetical protein
MKETRVAPRSAGNQTETSAAGLEVAHRFASPPDNPVQISADGPFPEIDNTAHLRGFREPSYDRLAWFQFDRFSKASRGVVLPWDTEMPVGIRKSEHGGFRVDLGKIGEQIGIILQGRVCSPLRIMNPNPKERSLGYPADGGFVGVFHCALKIAWEHPLDLIPADCPSESPNFGDGIRFRD